MSTQSIKRRIYDGARRKECFYCRKALLIEDATIDHKVPRCKGGKTTIENSVIACSKCNNKKGGRNFDDFVRTLKWHKRQQAAREFRRKHGKTGSMAF